MKKIVALLFVFCVNYSYGQYIDTVKNSLQITPIVVNSMRSDTAYQLSWRISVERGIGNDGLGYVVLYDRFKNKVQDFNITIPASIISVWLDDSVIDNFILNKYKLTKRK